MCIIDYIMYRAYMGMSHRKGELREIGAHRYTLAISFCLLYPIIGLLFIPIMPQNENWGLLVFGGIFILYFIIFEKRYNKRRIAQLIKRYKKTRFVENNNLFLITLIFISIIYAVCFAVFFHSVTEKYHLNGCLYHLLGFNI